MQKRGARVRLVIFGYDLPALTKKAIATQLRETRTRVPSAQATATLLLGIICCQKIDIGTHLICQYFRLTRIFVSRIHVRFFFAGHRLGMTYDVLQGPGCQNLSEALFGLYDLHGNVNHLMMVIVGKTGTWRRQPALSAPETRRTLRIFTRRPGKPSSVTYGCL